MEEENNNLYDNIRDGFTLIELSIVVIVLGLIAGGIMAALTQNTRREKQISLIQKMDAIELALTKFVKKNGYIPCPADGTYAVTVANFGKAGGTAGGGTCINGATYDGNGNRTADTTPPTANFSSGNTVGGVAPVRTLELPDGYAFDPWVS